MGVTIDEAIEKYKKLSEEAENNATSYAHLEEFKRELKHNTEARYCELSKEECLANAIEYRQLAEWLEQLQKIEDIYYHQSGEALEDSLRSVIEDGKID